MSRFNKKSFEPLDQEEMDIMESIEKDEWSPVKNFVQERDEAMKAARHTIKKEKRINLHFSLKD